MRGAPESMRLIRPRSVPEALRAYARDPQALPLAGGTDLLVSWNMGLLNGRTVLDLSGLREWSALRAEGGRLRIGALATHAALQAHPVVRRSFPLLAAACATIGGLQIQNRGSLGGNIANASPAADSFPPLAVYEAEIVALSPRGRRRIPFRDFFAGVKKTRLGSAELIEAVELPLPRRRPDRGLFRKVGTRAASAISKTVAAGLLWLAPDGSVEELRFALGSMAPTVRRLAAAEAFLRGRRLDEKTGERACRLLEADVSPIDDMRSTREYRLAASRNILRGFLMGAVRGGAS